MKKLLILTTIAILCFISTAANFETRTFVATAYSIHGRTSSGEYTKKGMISADPRILPLGTKVELEAGNYSGNYTVKDTGGSIRNNKIDIWMNNKYDAIRLGKRKVLLTILSYGNKNQKRSKRSK